ncbi:hypothetical protein EWM64_g6829 [Hericium alpestre]|uniref:Uncharacterized protein n=1 Tax=Hericium alpestre TaxID=135208 RepID=A0A4Y9ZQK6_9AGAM|nr:hypothetical protein EWM64_g6829 [Hericium alpestre]
MSSRNPFRTPAITPASTGASAASPFLPLASIPDYAPPPGPPPPHPRSSPASTPPASPGAEREADRLAGRVLVELCAPEERGAKGKDETRWGAVMDAKAEERRRALFRTEYRAVESEVIGLAVKW